MINGAMTTLLFILFGLLGISIALGATLSVRRVYRSLAKIERVTLWWWVAIAMLALASMVTQTYLLIGCAGVLMIGLGFLIGLDVGGIAERLGSRRMGFGPFWTQQSPAWWRFSGLFLVVIGAGWTLAFMSSF